MIINTLQEYMQARFNAAFRGLRWQGFKKVVDRFGATSILHGDAGCCCALGWSTKSELGDLPAPLERFRAIATPYRFDVALARCHDRSVSPADMEQRLRELAREYNLTIPPIDPRRGW